jgi:hypothetical protein
MATKIQFRRDTATNWSNTNPTLSQGEPGLDLCRGLIKVGNGSDGWNCLPFQGTGEAGCGAIAIGNNAGDNSQSQYAVAIGCQAGECCQGCSAVAIGKEAGQCYQEQYAVAIGYRAAECCQSQYSVAIGYRAGNCDQGQGPWSDGYAVAIGAYAGECCQEYHAIAIGREAGQYCQEFSAVAIGRSAGRCGQNNGAVAVGKQSGQSYQGQDAVAIGNYAGSYEQGNYAVAIGYKAAYGQCGCSQGQYAIAIGAYAAECYQSEHSIAINADGDPLNPENQGFYVNPVREFDTCFACGPDGGTVLTSVFYDPSTKEVIRAPQMPQNAVTTNGDYTLALTDAGKHVYKTGTGNVLIDINANVAFPIGTVVTLVTGSGNSTIISPVNSVTSTLILSKFGADTSINVPVDTYVTILKIEEDKWMIQT